MIELVKQLWPLLVIVGLIILALALPDKKDKANKNKK